jgi:hypothetical protein
LVKLAFAGYIMAVFKDNETALTEAKTVGSITEWF